MTATAAEAYTAEQLARQAGVDLLDALLTRLLSMGYRKIAIDTYQDPASGHAVRHSYANNEWTLTSGYEQRLNLEVRYSTRATMPSVDELIEALVIAPF